MNDELNFEEVAPWLVLATTLLGGLLRLLFIGTDGLWLDETFSIWLASQDLPDMLHWIARLDGHPPLYYLLLHAWIAFQGDSAYYVRSLSALFGTAAIPVLYLTGKRISGVGMGLVAAVLLAFSPFNIYYAQEARMYTLLTFNAAVAIYALIWLLTDERAGQPIGSQFRAYVHAWRTAGPARPDSAAGFHYQVEPPRRGLRAWIYRHRWSPIHTIATDLAWVAFIVFSAATLLSHNTAIFFPIATNLVVFGLLLYRRIKGSAAQPALQPPGLANWVKANIAILILWGPWLVIFARQAGRIAQGFWIPSPTGETVTQALRALLYTSAPVKTGQALMMGLLGGLLGLGVVFFRKRLSIFFFLAALFAVPFLGELVVSLRWPIFLERTLIWLTIPLFLLLAAGIVQLRFRLLMIPVLGILATGYLFTTADYYRWYQKEDWRTAAGFLAYFAKNDDLVLFNSNFVVIPFDYYFRAWEEDYRLEVEKQGVPRDLFDSEVLEPRMTAADVPALLSLIRGHDRVWLVYSHNSYTDPLGLVPQTLAAHLRLSRERQFYGGQVQLYVSP